MESPGSISSISSRGCCCCSCCSACSVGARRCVWPGWCRTSFGNDEQQQQGGAVIRQPGCLGTSADQLDNRTSCSAQQVLPPSSSQRLQPLCALPSVLIARVTQHLPGQGRMQLRRELLRAARQAGSSSTPGGKMLNSHLRNQQQLRVYWQQQLRGVPPAVAAAEMAAAAVAGTMRQVNLKHGVISIVDSPMFFSQLHGLQHAL